MIKAIIFDCYGVLVRDGWLPFCERHFGDNADLMERAHSLSHAMNRGYVNMNDYINELGVMTHSDPVTVAAEINRNAPNKQLFEWIRAWKAHYKVGILSNAGENALDRLIGADNAALFDAVVMSYEVGAAKPDTVMYDAIANKLEVAPEACLFIDDQAQYCEGARLAGMQAVPYVGNAQLQKEIAKYNVFLNND